jgi:maltooligosyltrehalose trehalohydrolase
VLSEIAERVRCEAGRPALLVAEDDRNLARLVRPPAEGGYGLDGVWADDFHHQVRVRLAGDRDGYFADYDGSAEALARTLRSGWLYTGQRSSFRGGSRGTDPAGIPLERFVVCVQNHDQVGNRAFGDRLHHAVSPEAFRAAVALLLLAPETPLLFMGQEWAASTPFLYFTDHEPALGRLVAEGRRRELGSFRALADPESRGRIPDPQAAATFEASRLRWEERDREPHASVLRLHRALLALRRAEIVPRRARFRAAAAGERGLLLDYGDLAAAVWLEGAGQVALPPVGEAALVLLSTEDPAFAPDARPARLDLGGRRPVARFEGPGAVVLGLG